MVAAPAAVALPTEVSEAAPDAETETDALPAVANEERTAEPEAEAYTVPPPAAVLDAAAAV
jgi:hypothetical protein